MTGRDPKWFGNLLRQLRQQKGLSFDGVEAQSGFTAVAVGSYERCDRRPTVERAERLLDFYDMQLTAAPKGYDLDRLLRENAELREFKRQIMAAAETEGLVVRPAPLAAVPDDQAA